jgi:hypothetical protein
VASFSFKIMFPRSRIAGRLGMVAYTCKPSTLESETKGPPEPILGNNIKRLCLKRKEKALHVAVCGSLTFPAM